MLTITTALPAASTGFTEVDGRGVGVRVRGAPPPDAPLADEPRTTGGSRLRWPDRTIRITYGDGTTSARAVLDRSLSAWTDALGCTDLSFELLPPEARGVEYDGVN